MTRIGPLSERYLYSSADDVADCQGAELYLEQLIYQYPYLPGLDELHALIKKQNGVYDGTCIELARKADRLVKTESRKGSKVKQRKTATELKGIKRFTSERRLIQELERWGNPENTKTGKVYWHTGERKFLLVPGNPSKADVAGSLAPKDQYGDDLPEDKARIKDELHFVSLGDLKQMAKEFGAKPWYVDNVYGKRVYREEYDKKGSTMLKRKSSKANLHRRRHAARGDAFIRYTDEFGSEVQLEIDDELIGVFNNQDEAIEFMREWANENHYYPPLYLKDIDATLEEIDYGFPVYHYKPRTPRNRWSKTNKQVFNSKHKKPRIGKLNDWKRLALDSNTILKIHRTLMDFTYEGEKQGVLPEGTYSKATAEQVNLIWALLEELINL